ncbi:creatininase [Clostridiales bacterium PH28_bin88]|nr:creatininase [Clostridiales bacterium PH28_bin88]
MNSTTRGNYLLEITQPEAEAILDSSKMALIPTGSVEQHGPHLPCGTDYYAALAISKRAAEQLGALLLPFSQIGVTPFHMTFKGTLTLRPETYMEVLRDVCKSVIRHGAEKIAIINWHEGNTASINTAAASLQIEYPKVRFLIVQACYIASQLYADESDLTHGGALEALPVVGYVPHLAHLERATNPSDEARARKIDALRRSKTAYPILEDIRWIAPTGWYGSLEMVTPEKAEEFLARVSDAVVKSIKESFAQVEEILREENR